MFIIVDSGSSKADWACISDTGVTSIFTTPGINPGTQESLLDLTLFNGLVENIINSQSIYFYAAGMSSIESKLKTEHWLRSYGCVCSIETASDALAGARACFGDDSGILCILGTGSNAVYFDGQLLIESIPSLGYMLSDEGGGVHLGKEILKSYIYGTMPSDIKNAFEETFGQISSSEIIKQLYQNQGGSGYIASFAALLTNVQSSWKDDLINRCFEEFLRVRVLFLKKKYEVPIKIIGSIGYLHQNNLIRVFKNQGFDIAEFIQKPILPLIEYHKNKNK